MVSQVDSMEDWNSGVSITDICTLLPANGERLDLTASNPERLLTGGDRQHSLDDKGHVRDVEHRGANQMPPRDGGFLLVAPSKVCLCR